MKVSVHEDDLRLLVGQWRDAASKVDSAEACTAFHHCADDVMLAIQLARDHERAKTTIASRELTKANQ